MKWTISAASFSVAHLMAAARHRYANFTTTQ